MKHLILFDYHLPKYLLQNANNRPIVVGLIAGVSAISIGLTSFAPASLAQSRNSVYKPTAITSGLDINDILTDKDIPTGQKGFARDYEINVQKDERLEISANSESFDTVLSLLDSKGEVVAENDDYGDSTNSLIFFKVRQSGNYIIRVSSFGGSSGGKFTLRVNKLRIVN